MLAFCRLALKPNNYLSNREISGIHVLKRSFSKSKTKYPIQTIRNFCIIAHIDHGKSTLADRLLELTDTIPRIRETNDQQYLDKLKVERDRGITVKAQTASMFYKFEGKDYLLNLVDTPGHVDFTYEVSRSMHSCDGALLLVDASQGIQAQTLSNYELAKEANLKIIPVLNKVDIVSANVEACIIEMQEQFNIDEKDVLKVSAKTGLNVEKVIDAIVQRISHPKGSIDKPFRGFIVDCWYEKNRGVITLIQVVDGWLQRGDAIVSHANQKKYDIFEVGIMHPEMQSEPVLTAGQVGYIIMNMKTVSESRIGDTFYKQGTTVEVFPGFRPAKQMVFAGIYPEDPQQYNDLDKAIYKLALTDPAVTIIKESSASLGHGFRCGFLGLLHMDVFKQRLDDEYEISTILTVPSVSYRCKLKGGKMIDVDNALHSPDAATVSYYEEPYAEGTLIFPKVYLSEMINFCQDRRGEEVSMKVIDNQKVVLKYLLPMSEIITDFFDKIKGLTKGYATFDFEFKEYRRSEVEKLVVVIMGEDVDALSFMIHKSRVESHGRKICQKLRESIPPQQFPVVIQARAGKKIVAREEISMMKKNVTAKCYGGDYSRKKKLLDKQKTGKMFMRKIGRVEVSKETFISVMKVD